MIFDRKKYKADAKAKVKGNVFKFFPICLILFGFSGLSSFFSNLLESFDSFYLVFINIIAFIISGIIYIATDYFFLNVSKDLTNLKFSTWADGLNLWSKGIVSNLLVFIWTLLWSLLFIIPGIVKGIAYSQANYIIAENPSIAPSKAIKISKIITKGYKGDLFFMGLSFLGWIILSIFTLGILFFWLQPYMELSFAKAYTVMKENALQNGSLTEEDFK